MNSHQNLNCTRWLELLSEYIDGELSEASCAELESHLDTCPECKIVLNTTIKSIFVAEESTKATLPIAAKNKLFDILSQVKCGKSTNDLLNEPKNSLGRCPQCGDRSVDVDGMLMRFCRSCGWRECGSFT